jgi:hypothetical protein
LFRAGDEYYDGLDDWDKEWLKRKILAGTRAYKFIRAIPLIGFYWSLIVTGGRRKNIGLVFSELELGASEE